MNWVDLLILLVLILFILDGVGKRFFWELLDLFSFIMAFLLSLRFYNLAADFLDNNLNVPHSLSNVLGFITIWFLVESLLFSIIHLSLLRHKFITEVEKPLNRFSFIPSFLRGLIFITVILLLVGIFPIQPKLKSAVEGSQIGSRLLSQAVRLETPFKKVFGGISQDTLTFLTIKPKSDETVNLGFQTNNLRVNSILEDKMIDLVNEERSKLGLKILTFNSDLRDVARGHSTDMFQRGYFSHNSPEGKNVADRAEEKGIKYLVIGENLAYAPDLSLAHQGLMNSEGHRANILSEDYNKIGIGIMDGGIYGLMITQVFSN
ncbi:CvpA family protein [Candidatus Daviesbacteria bacterium]|nr:CvpA family protein [Candidatus Daviesbacteria bacterium]